MRIERHGAVIEDDLPAIYAFIARDDRAAAERVLDAVDTTLALLASQPECGVLFPSRNASLRGVRMLPVTGFSNYLVFYRITGMPSACSTSFTVHGICHGFSGASRAYNTVHQRKTSCVEDGVVWKTGSVRES